MTGYRTMIVTAIRTVMIQAQAPPAHLMTISARESARVLVNTATGHRNALRSALGTARSGKGRKNWLRSAARRKSN